MIIYSVRLPFQFITVGIKLRSFPLHRSNRRNNTSRYIYEPMLPRKNDEDHSLLITIEDIARYIGMNRSSPCVFFRKHTGDTIVSAINKRRLEVAYNLLRNAALSVREICDLGGFNDYPYFCRIFKRTFNITPTVYRKNILCI